MYSIAPRKAKPSLHPSRQSLLGLSVLLWLTAGCMGGDPNAAGSPESAQRELFHALLDADPAVTSYLSAETNRQLDAAAAALGPELDPAAARRSVLASSGVPEPRTIASFKRVKESKDEVTLETRLRDGRTIQTRWRREQGKWVAMLQLAPAGGS